MKLGSDVSQVTKAFHDLSTQQSRPHSIRFSISKWRVFFKELNIQIICSFCPINVNVVTFKSNFHTEWPPNKYILYPLTTPWSTGYTNDKLENYLCSLVLSAMNHQSLKHNVGQTLDILFQIGYFFFQVQLLRVAPCLY